MGWRSTSCLLAGVQSSRLDGTQRHEHTRVRRRPRRAREPHGSGARRLHAAAGRSRPAATTSCISSYRRRLRRPLSASRRGDSRVQRAARRPIESRGTTRLFADRQCRASLRVAPVVDRIARYHRGVIFIDEVADPLLSDAVTMSLSGLLSRAARPDWLGILQRGASWGCTAKRALRHVSAAAGACSSALSPTAALYGEYLLFHYRFAEPISLGPAFRSHLDRQTVRVGVTVHRDASFAEGRRCCLAGSTPSTTSSAMMRRRAWIIVAVPVLLAGVATWRCSIGCPNRYRSDTLILVVPQRVPESYVKATVTTRIEDRLQSHQPAAAEPDPPRADHPRLRPVPATSASASRWKTSSSACGPISTSRWSRATRSA